MLLRVTKKITAILLVLIMLISFLPANLQANAAESYSVKVTGSTVNVRSGAGTKYGKVGSAKKNQSFKYLSSAKDSSGRTWYKIQYSSSKTGWVTSQYAKLIKTTVTTTRQPTATTTSATVVSGTDITTVPTTSTSTTTTTTATKPYVNPSCNYTLSKGSKGTKVTQMQNRLLKLGYIAESADGDYGNNTVRAVKAFQKIAGLEVTGVADPVTLTKLYASSAPKAPVTYNHADVYKPDYKKDYYIIVYQKNGRVLVLGKDDYGKYNQVIKCFTCSVGVNNKTPNGLYKINKRYRWNLLFGDVYGQYCVRFYGHYLFHSVPYAKQSADTLQTAEFNKLGSPASKGCIRLCVRDTKWIYDNAVNGTQVRIISNKNCTVQPDEIPEINTEVKYKGWDPTDPAIENPYNG